MTKFKNVSGPQKLGIGMYVVFHAYNRHFLVTYIFIQSFSYQIGLRRTTHSCQNLNSKLLIKLKKY